MIEKMQVYNGFVMCWVLFYLPLFFMLWITLPRKDDFYLRHKRYNSFGNQNSLGLIRIISRKKL